MGEGTKLALGAFIFLFLLNIFVGLFLTSSASSGSYAPQNATSVNSTTYNSSSHITTTVSSSAPFGLGLIFYPLQLFYSAFVFAFTQTGSPAYGAFAAAMAIVNVLLIIIFVLGLVRG